jgi:hypothetical protein
LPKTHVEPVSVKAVPPKHVSEQQDPDKRDVENLEMLAKFKQQVMEQETRLAD